MEERKTTTSTRKIIIELYINALEINDKDAYTSNWVLSSIWGDDSGKDEEIPKERIIFVKSMWDAAHKSIKDIAKDAGLSCRKLAEHFGIPYRTMESWSSGHNECPYYEKMMMQECLGLLPLNIK